MCWYVRYCGDITHVWVADARWQGNWKGEVIIDPWQPSLERHLTRANPHVYSCAVHTRISYHECDHNTISIIYTIHHRVHVHNSYTSTPPCAKRFRLQLPSLCKISRLCNSSMHHAERGLFTPTKICSTWYYTHLLVGRIEMRSVQPHSNVT